ncbi:hypothetical protein V7S57_16805 [Caulobacter sp. CCNWLY153]|uniref:hypothetical protein n=1 Tax=unclassified Caulobacter TaxID=2648921 RepID=UPI002FF0F4BD
MGQRRKAGDQLRLPAISRRAVIAASGVPVVGSARAVGGPKRVSIPARCAAWVALDQEIDRIARRWSELEDQAVRQFDYFNLSPERLRALPMSAEMAAIDAETVRLGDISEEALGPLGKLKPRSAQDAVALLSVAYRLLALQEEPAWPFVRSAWEYLSRCHCPDCGAAYAAPETLPAFVR